MTSFQWTVYKKLDRNIPFTEDEIIDFVGGTLQFKNRYSQTKIEDFKYEITVISKVGKRYVKTTYYENFTKENIILCDYSKQPIEVSKKEYEEID